MAAKEIEFYRQYQPDFLKVMHDIDFEPVGPIDAATDWPSMPVLDPTAGNFGDQLVTLKEIRQGLGPDVPMIDTIFGVYHYADKICGGKLRAHLAENPDAVHKGLEALTESLARYARATVDSGCDGIYYALSGSSAEGLAPAEYRKHFLAYDKAVLGAVDSAPFNVLHLHGYKDLDFSLAADIPFAGVCWSDRTSGPSLAEARKQLPNACFIAGLDETRFAKMSKSEIEDQVLDAALQSGESRIIVGPGCAIPETTAPELIAAIGAAVARPRP
jgi:uroporphyrinogen decarboxylase